MKKLQLEPMKVKNHNRIFTIEEQDNIDDTDKEHSHNENHYIVETEERLVGNEDCSNYEDAQSSVKSQNIKKVLVSNSKLETIFR